MFLHTVAPTESADVHLGVFARNENVSSLLQASARFLPTCFHVLSQPVNLILSQVNDGPIWAQEAAVPALSSGGRLLPSSPPLLQPNLTGQYQCTAPGQTPSRGQYRLHVVGKKEARLNIFIFCSSVSTELCLHLFGKGTLNSVVSCLKNLDSHEQNFDKGYNGQGVVLE